MPIVIVGAGICGVALAIGLRRLGEDVVVLEARDRAEEIGAGITLWPNGMATLEALGIPMDEASRVFRHSEIRDWRGRPWRRLALHRVGDALGQDTRLTGRRDLMHALLAELRAVGGEIRGGHRVQDLDPDRGEVILSDGRRISGDATIGADGVRSTVRTVGLGPWTSTDQGRTSYRGLIDGPATLPATGVQFVEHHGAGGRFACYEIGDGRVAWYANLVGPEDDAPQTIAALETWFRGWADPVVALVGATTQANLHRTRIRASPPFPTRVRGRVALIGDAAQPMTPDLGQGANQGLEDVASLLLAIATAPSSEAAFARYQEERGAIAAAIAARSAKIGRISNLSGRGGLWARRLMWSSIPERTSVRGLIALARDGVERGRRLGALLASRTPR